MFQGLASLPLVISSQLFSLHLTPIGTLLMSWIDLLNFILGFVEQWRRMLLDKGYNSLLETLRLFLINYSTLGHNTTILRTRFLPRYSRRYIPLLEPQKTQKSTISSCSFELQNHSIVDKPKSTTPSKLFFRLPYFRIVSSRISPHNLHGVALRFTVTSDASMTKLCVHLLRIA